MKQKLGGLVLCLALSVSIRAWGKDLPDACGGELVHFDVSTGRGEALPPPAAGKAQVVFVESVDEDFCLGCNQITTRAGIDGAWVGANKGQSYFAVDVEPGQHKICADWQRIFYGQVDVLSFTAEPGAVHYFMVRVTNRTRKVGGVEQKEQRVRFLEMSDSEGRRRMNDSNLSIATVYR